MKKLIAASVCAALLLAGCTPAENAKETTEETAVETTVATEAPTEVPTEAPTEAPTEESTEAPTEPQVKAAYVEFEFDKSNFSGRFTAFDEEENVIWEYFAEERPGTQVVPIKEIGLWNDVYYLYDGPCLKALDASNGAILWELELFTPIGGAFAEDLGGIFTFTADGKTLTLISLDGEILQEVPIDLPLSFPSNIRYEGELVLIDFDSPDGIQTVYVDPLDWSYGIVESSVEEDHK